MRCLSGSEIKKWLSGQGMHLHPGEYGFPIAGEYEMPLERRARLGLADQLADLLCKDGTKLVEILPPGSCDGIESGCLAGFRARSEEHRSLAQSPGHLFKSREGGEFRCLLSMLLGFEPGWGIYIYAAPSRTILRIADRIDIWSSKRGLRNELGRRLPGARAA